MISKYSYQILVCLFVCFLTIMIFLCVVSSFFCIFYWKVDKGISGLIKQILKNICVYIRSLPLNSSVLERINYMLFVF